VSKFYEKSEKIKKDIEDMMVHTQNNYSSNLNNNNTINNINNSIGSSSNVDPKQSLPKAISLNEARKKFLEINQKEEELQELFSEVNSNNLNFQIHSKIDDMYNILEKSIDAVQKSEIDSFNRHDSIIFNEEEQNFKIKFSKSKDVLKKSVDLGQHNHPNQLGSRKKLAK